MKKQPIDISIVFGGGNDDLIIKCLESIEENYRGAAEICVVSNLGSLCIQKTIKKRWPNVRLIVNREVKGFATNHNQVIRITSNPYVLILNDDTEILEGSLEKLINYLDRNPAAAAVSPKLLNPDGSLQQSTYGFPNLFTALVNFSGIRNLIPFNKVTCRVLRPFMGAGKSRFWNHDKTCVVDTIRGACVLMRRKAIDEVGLMDEICKAYGEETEWHCRLKNARWKIVFLHDAPIIHYGQQTTSRQPIREEQAKGLLNFFKKHKSGLDYRLFQIAAALISFARGCFYLLFLKKNNAKYNFKIMKTLLMFDKKM